MAGILDRIAAAFRRGDVTPVSKTKQITIADIGPDTWMSPLQPLPPYLPTVEARQLDYRVGRNLYYLPRGEERIGFRLLRDIADGCDLVRFAIETRKDQLGALSWDFKTIDDDGDAEDSDDPRVELLKEFFAFPDKNNSWRDWLRQLLEEVFVTDALTIYRRRKRGGDPYALELIDGSTIFPLVDSGGRRPLPPEPAYQQILKGMPKADYDTTELTYAPYTKRIYKFYGLPVVEQVMNAAQTEIERMKSQLAYFTDGSYPDKYVTAPEGMSPDKVLAWEKRINDMLSGNLAARRTLPFMVNGTEIKELKAPALKDEFDEWLARKICFAFSLPPTAFIKQNNRATAQSEKDRALEEGLNPLMEFVKGVIDRIIHEDFGFDDIEFVWSDKQDVDPAVQATVDASDAKSSIRSINEIRSDRGLPPVKGGDEPLLATATGWVPLPGSDLDNQMKQEQQAQLQAQQQHAIALANAQPEPAANENEGGNKPPSKKPVVKKKFTYASSSHLH